MVWKRYVDGHPRARRFMPADSIRESTFSLLAGSSFRSPEQRQLLMALRDILQRRAISIANGA
jgi:hypothetical protein